MTTYYKELVDDLQKYNPLNHEYNENLPNQVSNKDDFIKLIEEMDPNCLDTDIFYRIRCFDNLSDLEFDISYKLVLYLTHLFLHEDQYIRTEAMNMWLSLVINNTTLFNEIKSETYQTLKQLSSTDDIITLDRIFNLVKLVSSNNSKNFDVFSKNQLIKINEQYPSLKPLILNYIVSNFTNGNEIIDLEIDLINDLIVENTEFCIEPLCNLVNNNFDIVSRVIFENFHLIFAYLENYPNNILQIIWRMLEKTENFEFLISYLESLLHFIFSSHSLLGVSILHKVFLLSYKSKLISSDFYYLLVKSLNDDIYPFDFKEHCFLCIMDIIQTGYFDVETCIQIFFENFINFYESQNSRLIEKAFFTGNILFMRAQKESKQDLFLISIEKYNFDLDELFDGLKEHVSEKTYFLMKQFQQSLKIL